MRRVPPPGIGGPEPFFLVPIQVPVFAGVFVLIHAVLQEVD